MSSTGPRGSGRWWKAEVGYRLARLHGSYNYPGGMGMFWRLLDGGWQSKCRLVGVVLSTHSTMGGCGQVETRHLSDVSDNTFTSFLVQQLLGFERHFWWHCPTQHSFLVRPVYRGLLLIFRGCLTLSRLACRSMPNVGWEIPTPTGHESCSWTNRRKWLVLHAL